MQRSAEPTWVRNYINIPFEDGGRSSKGCDCWGLACIVYSEQFATNLPLLSTVKPGDIAAGRVAVNDLTKCNWVQVGDANDFARAKLGDIVLAEVLKQPHVGIVVSQAKMLHTLKESYSVVERFNTPLWLPRIRGLYRYAGPVHVTYSHSPLVPASVDATIEAGLSVQEIASLYGIAQRVGIRAFVGDREVPRERWSIVRPRPGRVLRYTCVPEGGGGDGGKSPLRTVMSLALVAASIAAPFALVGLGADAAVWGAGTLGGGLFAAGVGIVGSLALNALIPAPSSVISNAAGFAGSPSITGARNSLRKFSPVPVILGRHRVVPSYAAVPYTETVNGEQYLRLLFLVGYGPLELSDMRIGETPLSEFEGVEVQTRAGGDDDGPLSLYPSTIIEDPESLLLRQTSGLQLRTSAIEADELAVEFTFPQGLVEIARDGSRIERTVALQVQYAPTGTQNWVDVNATSPEDTRPMDMLFRTPEVTLGGSGEHAGELVWGAGFSQPKPAYLPASNYSWEAEGWVYVSGLRAAGRNFVEFAIDGSDACDIAINNRLVVQWYGTHPTEGGATPGTTRRSVGLWLGIGWHRIRVRMEARAGNGGAIAAQWRLGGDPVDPFVPIPANALSLSASTAGAGKLRYRWFDTQAFSGTLVVTASTTDTIKRTVSWAVPKGQYDIRVQRLTPDTNSESILDKVFLTSIRTIRSSWPINMRGCSVVALRIKASGQLNGVVDEFNLIAESVLPDWDWQTQSWITRATRNVASCWRAVLQGPSNKQPVPDSGIDMLEVQAWHDECRLLGFECNAVIDFKGTVEDRLRDVAATGRARNARTNGLRTPVRERRHTTHAQHFTTRNTANFKGRKAFGEVPHALRIGFINELRGYQRDERVVYNDGYSAENATKFDTLDMFGVTNPEQVYRLGRYNLAAMILRPEVYSFDTSTDHIACNVGDMVFLTHDVPLFGLQSAWVVARILDSNGNVIGLRLDENITQDAGDEYVVRVRLADGRTWTNPVRTIEGVSRDVMFPAIVPATGSPEAGDLLMFGRPNTEVRPVIIKNISVNPDLTATITVVDEAPAVLTADTEDIPDYNPGISTPPEYEDRPEVPIIDEVRSDDYVLYRAPDGTLLPRIVIAYHLPSSRRPLADFVQVRLRRIPAIGQAGQPGTSPWRTLPQISTTPSQVSIGEVEEGEAYEIRMRSVTAIGQASEWATVEHVVIGKALPPPDVLAFDVQRLADGVRRYTWDLGVIPPDVVGVQIRFGPSPGPLEWDRLQPLHEGTLEGASPTDLMQPAASGRYYFAIKMVDSVGNVSRNARTIERNLGAGSRDGVAISVDARALGFPGTKTGCYLTRAGDLEAIGDETWDELDSMGAATWDGWNAWAVRPVTPIVYEHPAIDVGFLLDFSPAYECNFFGDILVEFKYSLDGSTWTEYVPIRQLAGTSIRARYVQYKVSVSVRDGFPVPSITALVFLLRAETISQVINDLNTANLTGDTRLAVGDIRVPITSSQFGNITSVRVTFNGTGAGYTWEIVDRSITPGPRIRIYGPDDQPADAVIDAEVVGVRNLTLT